MKSQVGSTIKISLAAILILQTGIAHAGSLEGARLDVSNKLDDANNNKPCPESTYRNSDGTRSEGLALLAGGLISSFAGKAVNAFVDWLEKRKERLNGTRTATFTGNFYQGGLPAAKCITFTAATFHDDGTASPVDIYAEFVPVYYDLGAYTLKPVYLEYNRTIAQAASKFKFTSLVISQKYNAPVEAEEGSPIDESALVDGPTFTFTFGKLKPGTTLDHKSLEAVNGGIGQVAPQFKDASTGRPRPLAYQMDALWSDTAEPSPLYTAAVESLKDNKDKIGEEIGKAIKEILGIKEEKEE